MRAGHPHCRRCSSKLEKEQDTTHHQCGGVCLQRAASVAVAVAFAVAATSAAASKATYRYAVNELPPLCTDHTVYPLRMHEM
ncbi:hypothetical protein M0802_010194 [Mischocyttarus mexicanus]|nr:hypothetical protein M0802_010194 [Mischocyttarus mexicanus]